MREEKVEREREEGLDKSFHLSVCGMTMTLSSVRTERHGHRDEDEGDVHVMSMTTTVFSEL